MFVSGVNCLLNCAHSTHGGRLPFVEYTYQECGGTRVAAAFLFSSSQAKNERPNYCNVVIVAALNVSIVTKMTFVNYLKKTLAKYCVTVLNCAHRL